MKTAVKAAFFLALLVLGVRIHGDYGMAFDEVQQRYIALVSMKHIVEQVAPSRLPDKYKEVPALNDYYDRDYGVAVELPFLALEALFRIDDKKDAFVFRHLLTFLLGVAGAFAVYRLASRRFLDWRIGLLATLLFVVSPRLFADSFYNSKDGAFMAVFAIAMATTVSFVLRPSFLTAFLHALATGFAIDVRIVAVMLALATLAILAVRLVKGELPLRATLQALALYVLLTLAAVVAMWPWLWSDPIGHFAQAFANMSKFRWNLNVLYMGEYIRSSQLPWHYIPVWIGITTPLLYLLLFVIGAVGTLTQIVRRNVTLWKGDAELQDIVFLGLFAAPILAAIATRAVLYDGWRQLYFLYPAFILVAAKGWVVLWQIVPYRIALRPLLVGMTAVSIAFTAAWMWRAHPYQNVYFNDLAGKNLRTRFEMDYWGLANRRALEHILSVDKSPIVHVLNDAVTPVYFAFNIIDAAGRARLRYSSDGQTPDYIVTNYRFSRPTDNTDQSDTRYAKDYDPFYRVEVDGEAILAVFRHKSLAR
ncbi:MAG: hypothetical protein NTV97_24680 [Alphaproteobacteria bacterium]|nr:hypothetical protein [Alphaproteobacteria bacterium]